MLLGTMRNKFFLSLKSIHLGKMSLKRSRTLSIEPGRIHHHIIKVSDLLGDTPLLILFSRYFLYEFSKILNVLVRHFGDSAPHRVLERLRIQVSPMSCSKSREVIARTRSRVHVCVIDTGCFYRFVATACSCKKRRTAQQ